MSRSNRSGGGDLTIDEDSYAAKVRGRALDLTYKEFELLKFLAQHPGRVFRARSYCRKSGVTTTSKALAPLMSTCDGCVPRC